MKQRRKILGVAILLLVFVAIFSLTAIQYGLIEALINWGIAVILAFAVIVGARLTVGH